LGGRIGLHMAMLHPERIEGLVIVDFGPHPNPEARERVRSSVADDARTYGSIGAYAAQLMSRRPFLSPIVAHQIARDSLRPCAGGWELKCDPAVARSFGAGQGDDAVWAMLGDIRCPVLVVRGQLSAILTPQTAEKMAKVARNGRMQTVQRVGHGVVTENPEGLAAAVQNFLDDVTADPRGADRAEPRVGPRSDPWSTRNDPRETTNATATLAAEMTVPKPNTSFSCFESLDVRVGTIMSAVEEKTKKPTYRLTIDFGGDIGQKISCGDNAHEQWAKRQQKRKASEAKCLIYW
jgi:tRNA-binding EMAP/Myf-like protein